MVGDSTAPKQQVPNYSSHNQKFKKKWILDYIFFDCTSFNILRLSVVHQLLQIYSKPEDILH